MVSLTPHRVHSCSTTSAQQYVGNKAGGNAAADSRGHGRELKNSRSSADIDWSSKKLLFHCDNLAVVSVWESGLARSSELMRLVRDLFYIAAKHNFHVLIRHIAGVDN